MAQPRFLRHRAINNGLLHVGPTIPSPQMLVKDDTVKGGWRVLPYGVFE